MPTYYIVHTSVINELRITNQEEYNTWFKLLVVIAERLNNKNAELHIANILKSNVYLYIKQSKEIVYTGLIQQPLEEDLELTLPILTDLCLFGEILD